jgi:hypothetical protein
MVPHAGPQATPFCVNVQVAPLFVTSLLTVAVNCCVPFRATLAGFGDTDTEMRAMVTLALAEAPVFVTEVATMDSTPPKK